MFEIGSKASHGVSNDSKKNVFLVVSYLFGPSESAWTAAVAFSLQFTQYKGNGVMRKQISCTAILGLKFGEQLL